MFILLGGHNPQTPPKNKFPATPLPVATQPQDSLPLVVYIHQQDFINMLYYNDITAIFQYSF